MIGQEHYDNKTLILDFDGTICQVFKNFDFTPVFSLLEVCMAGYGIDFKGDKDAFDVFQAVLDQTEEGSDIRAKALGDSHRILTEAEMKAVETCVLVGGIEEVLPWLAGEGYALGIATNNSAECAQAFMSRYCPDIEIPIVGRIGLRPELMKPNPWSIRKVMGQVVCKHDDVIYVGDNQRDYQAANNMGCPFIGMAPTGSKYERLLKVLPKELIARDWNELVQILGR